MRQVTGEVAGEGIAGGRTRVGRVGQASALALIRAYQLVVSPLLGPACRYEPSCSEYAREAVRRHGAVRGLGLALRRLGRCHPLGGCGYDPVP
jgi:uncharacterized protein